MKQRTTTTPTTALFRIDFIEMDVVIALVVAEYWLRIENERAYTLQWQ